MKRRERTPEVPPNALTQGRDGHAIRWIGPGGVNAKGYRKVAYIEANPEPCDEPIEYDDQGYRLVLDGPPDMPSKLRRRIVFNENSWAEWWAHQAGCCSFNSRDCRSRSSARARRSARSAASRTGRARPTSARSWSPRR